jgi:hypothetical protein
MLQTGIHNERSEKIDTCAEQPTLDHISFQFCSSTSTQMLCFILVVVFFALLSVGSKLNHNNNKELTTPLQH